MTSFTKVYASMLGAARTLLFSASDPGGGRVVNPCLCWRLTGTPDLSLFFWLTAAFLLSPGAHNILSVPSKILFPQSCESAAVKSTGLQSQISWEFSVPLLDLQGWEICCGP